MNHAILILPILFLADYVALIYWLLRTANKPARSVRFRMRALLAAITIVAVHLAVFAGVHSGSAPP
jgi:hypothetical protein